MIRSYTLHAYECSDKCEEGNHHDDCKIYEEYACQFLTPYELDFDDYITCKYDEGCVVRIRIECFDSMGLIRSFVQSHHSDLVTTTIPEDDSTISIEATLGRRYKETLTVVATVI